MRLCTSASIRFLLYIRISIAFDAQAIESAANFDENVLGCTSFGAQDRRMNQSRYNLDPAVRRRFPRYKVDLRVDVRVFRAGQNLSLWGRSTELSEDGIGATLTAEVEPGEVVWLELTLPPPVRPVKIRALVRYRDGLRHGLEFLARSSEQREVLHQLCQSLAANK